MIWIEWIELELNDFCLNHESNRTAFLCNQWASEWLYVSNQCLTSERLYIFSEYCVFPNLKLFISEYYATRDVSREPRCRPSQLRQSRKQLSRVTTHGLGQPCRRRPLASFATAPPGHTLYSCRLLNPSRHRPPILLFRYIWSGLRPNRHSVSRRHLDQALCTWPARRRRSSSQRRCPAARWLQSTTSNHRPRCSLHTALPPAFRPRCSLHAALQPAFRPRCSLHAALQPAFQPRCSLHAALQPAFRPRCSLHAALQSALRPRWLLCQQAHHWYVQ